MGASDIDNSRRRNANQRRGKVVVDIDDLRAGRCVAAIVRDTPSAGKRELVHTSTIGSRFIELDNKRNAAIVRSGLLNNNRHQRSTGNIDRGGRCRRCPCWNGVVVHRNDVRRGGNVPTSVGCRPSAADAEHIGTSAGEEFF